MDGAYTQTLVMQGASFLAYFGTVVNYDRKIVFTIGFQRLTPLNFLSGEVCSRSSVSQCVCNYQSLPPTSTKVKYLKRLFSQCSLLVLLLNFRLGWNLHQTNLWPVLYTYYDRKLYLQSHQRVTQQFGGSVYSRNIRKDCFQVKSNLLTDFRFTTHMNIMILN